MVSHKEFATAGKKPGLQVWRIEKMDLKPVPEALHGSFYTGDAYLLLYTTAAPSYFIHMWIGTTEQSLHLKLILCVCVCVCEHQECLHAHMHTHVRTQFHWAAFLHSSHIANLLR